MLSIKRRLGPRAFSGEAAFGRSERGWPEWGELGPMLLRSAGIAGLAGVIMVIAAGDALFDEPLRQSRKEAKLPAPPQAQAAAIIVASQEHEPARLEMTSAPPTGVFLRQAQIEAPGASDALALAPSAAAPAADPVAPRLIARGELELRKMDAPGDASPTSDGSEVVALPAAAPDEPKVAALASTEAGALPAAPSSGAGQSAVDSVWDAEAASCGRDWLDGADPASAGEARSDCRPLALAEAPAAADDVDTTSGEVTLDEALESAAATRALKLAGFVARVPQARPDPPPVRKVRTTARRGGWPAAPPPDCGKLHAYWRFVDRKAGTKEWYCR